jgi:hypothetical protein
MALAFFEIVQSKAIQGIVVSLGGSAFVLLVAIHLYFRKKFLNIIFALASGALGVLGVLGALEKGPFSFIHKVSVSLRGQYWNAGIQMGTSHPLTGVGMDGYGDWYRRARSLVAATETPGPRVTTNAAHNVVIDFFAYGGWPLLLAYLGILLLVAVAIVRVLLRAKAYEPTFVALAGAWLCYQAQSIISINQIGLAIWGWLLTGALIAYEFTTRQDTRIENITSGRSGIKNQQGVFSPQLIGGIGIVVGLLIASPPLSADMNWRKAIESSDANNVLLALEPTYLHPRDSARYAQAVQLFANSNLMDQAHQVALKGVAFNADYFDAWRVLYSLPNSTEGEKAEALSNMKRLDPLNPDVLAQ